MSDFPPPPSSAPIPPSPPGYSGSPGYPVGPPSYGGVDHLGLGERAGFGARLGGWLLDGLLYGLLAAAFIGPAVAIGVSAFSECVTFNDEVFCPPGEPNGGLIAAAILLGLAGIILVFVLYVRALARTGQTWGRKIAGVKVVRKDSGEPLGMGAAIGRTLFAGVFSGNFFYLGYLWMLWDKDNQTWHDKVVSSVVVRA